MAELRPVNFVDALLHLIEELQAAARDAGNDVAPVRATPLTHNQLGVLEPVEQSRHIGDLPHQPLRHFISAQTVWLGASENPQNVVLRGGDLMRLQRGFKRVFQQRRRPLDAEVGLLFQRLERPRLFQLCLQLGGHIQYYVLSHLSSRLHAIACAVRRQRCPAFAHAAMTLFWP